MLSRINKKEWIFKYIVIKLRNIKDKEKILEVVWEKNSLYRKRDS